MEIRNFDATDDVCITFQLLPITQIVILKIV